MATSSERRILHITDNLENLNNTQIGFESNRNEEGLSYFGGAFGGKYDDNGDDWGNSITRFVRYQSNPILKSVVFDQRWNGASDNQLGNTDPQGQILLTTTYEMDEKSGLSYPSPNDIYPRGHMSINIGKNAGANVDNSYSMMDISTTSYNINIGDNSGINSYGNSGIVLGNNAGKNSKITFSFIAGAYAGLNSEITSSFIAGADAGNELICEDSVVIGNNAGNELICEESVVIGNNAGSMTSTQPSNGCVAIGRFSNSPGENCISIGSGAGYGITGNNENFICIGQNSGGLSTGSNRTICIGDESGYRSTSNIGIFLGWQAGGNPKHGQVTKSTGNLFIGPLAGYEFTPIDNDTPLIGGDDDWGINNGYNLAIGAMSFHRSSGTHNISLGYLALAETLADNTVFRNITIGAIAGYGLTGEENILIGYHAGSQKYNNSRVSGNAICIGSNTGICSDNVSDDVPESLEINSKGIFEIGMNPTCTNDDGENYRITNMLFSGNILESWVRSNGYLGLASLNNANRNNMDSPKVGFMCLDVEDIHTPVPKYYDGYNWQTFGGGSGVTKFVALNDTPSDYGDNNSVVKMATGGNALDFASTLFAGYDYGYGYESHHNVIRNGVLEFFVNKADDTEDYNRFIGLQLEVREYDENYSGAAYIHSYYDDTNDNGDSGVLNLEADCAINLNIFDSPTGNSGIHFRKASNDGNGGVEYDNIVDITKSGHISLPSITNYSTDLCDDCLAPIRYFNSYIPYSGSVNGINYYRWLNLTTLQASCVTVLESITLGEELRPLSTVTCVGIVREESTTPGSYNNVPVLVTINTIGTITFGYSTITRSFLPEDSDTVSFTVSYNNNDSYESSPPE